MILHFQVIRRFGEQKRGHGVLKDMIPRTNELDTERNIVDFISWYHSISEIKNRYNSASA
jgi:hypothetical protein